jgi:hypothetical protein
VIAFLDNTGRTLLFIAAGDSLMYHLVTLAAFLAFLLAQVSQFLTKNEKMKDFWL